ncbi:J domain-containing protein [Cryobacterium psychrophilum]|uniref:Heat-shock protein n=1 Tax=Cryobacterium psychrophilum TaxID=41988 RepID=A0A4Y8KPH1_9MICO|nr:J domain-containing protein [Cryobacterium psychrophilum]TDW28528.1 DnaJ-like protein [Cryobacterium psychrophilum]TFD80473.1 heat-shock protein [Cryobacterium psychrophilum]
MHESPAASTPYEVLGVAPSASDDALRRAYRLQLRKTHPDVGGSAAQFHAVQIAWERVGSPESRAAYDRTRVGDPESAMPADPFRTSTTPGSSASSRASKTSLKTRMHGHPGGRVRQQYLNLIREWAGRGTVIDDPYAPSLVRSAPRGIRHTLAKALAEETTAQLVSGLGIGFTAWHDVDSGNGSDKLDHVVLGPAGLFAVLSEDWGGEVQLRRGELVGDEMTDGEDPIRRFQVSAKAFTRQVRVRFTALVVVLPDSALDAPLSVAKRGRHPTVIVIPRSRLNGLLRDGFPGMDRGSFEKVFELRSTLQNGIRFVAT